MRVSNWKNGWLLVLMLIPAAVLGSEKPCPTVASTADSTTWNFPAEASRLLSDVRLRVYDVDRQAEGQSRLASSEFDQLTWQYFADHLAPITNDVNAMGRDLCRLQQIRQAALPWQQREIDRITPMLKDLAGRTEKAIGLLQTHELSFWATNFPKDMAVIRTDADQLHNSVVSELNYAKAESPTNPTSAGY